MVRWTDDGSRATPAMQAFAFTLMEKLIERLTKVTEEEKAKDKEAKKPEENKSSTTQPEEHNTSTATPNVAPTSQPASTEQPTAETPRTSLRRSLSRVLSSGGIQSLSSMIPPLHLPSLSSFLTPPTQTPPPPPTTQPTPIPVPSIPPPITSTPTPTPTTPAPATPMEGSAPAPTPSQQASIDPTYLAALPEELRLEVLASQLGPVSASSGSAPSSTLAPDFLAALPEGRMNGYITK